MNYLKVFFQEKNLDARIYEVNHGGQVHLVESELIIEMIQQAPRSEQTKIADVIRKLDFVNGDIHHFLNHLATGYVVNR